MNNKRKKFLALLLMLSLMLITVSVTYAVFTYTKQGQTENTITSGGIVFHYQELDGVGHGISIIDGTPVPSNDSAKTDNSHVFNFRITSKTNSKVDIPYIVTARLTDDSDYILGNIVDMYLTEVTSTGEKPTALFSSNLPKYVDLEQYDNEAYIEKVIYTDTVKASHGNYEKNFKLRMWIDEDAEFNTSD